MSEQVQNLQILVAKLERENEALKRNLIIYKAAARILSERGKKTSS